MLGALIFEKYHYAVEVSDIVIVFDVLSDTWNALAQLVELGIVLVIFVLLHFLAHADCDSHRPQYSCWDWHGAPSDG